MKCFDNKRQQERPFQETQLSLATSQITEVIMAISILMEDSNREKKRDSLTKSKEKEEAEWNKLPILSQKVIIGMQARYADNMDKDTTEDIVVPDRPSKTTNNVVRCSTGSQAQRFLNNLLTVNHNYIENPNMGMCTALKNGLLMSQPSPNKMSNFSPHFTSPFHMDKDKDAGLEL